MKFLIDVNLPLYFRLWDTAEYIHQTKINPTAKDKEIWEFARQQDLIIVTKDSDFSSRMLLASPPPKVIHIRIGNRSMKEFHRILNSRWPYVLQLIEEYKLVTVYENQVEGIS